MGGNGRLREDRGVAICRGGNRLPLGDQKSVGSDAERGVVMKAAPAAPLEVSEAKFLLELEVIALNAPAQFGEINQTGKADVLWQCRQPVLGRLLLISRHEQVGKCAGYEQAMSILVEAAVADHDEAEHPFDDVEGMLD